MELVNRSFRGRNKAKCCPSTFFHFILSVARHIVAKWKHGPYLDGPLRGESIWSTIPNPNYSQQERRWELFERRATAGR